MCNFSIILLTNQTDPDDDDVGAGVVLIDDCPKCCGLKHNGDKEIEAKTKTHGFFQVKVVRGLKLQVQLLVSSSFKFLT